MDEFHASNPAVAATGVGAESPTLNPPNAGPGVSTLNALTAANLTIEADSAGTDVAVTAATDTITISVPSASATARGAVTTGAQTIAGDKTLTGFVTAKKLRSTKAALTPGATVAMDLALGDSFTLTPAQDCTINASNIESGRMIVVEVVTSGTNSYTLTFGTGFKSTGTLATGTTTAKKFGLLFYSDGTDLIELLRTAAL